MLENTAKREIWIDWMRVFACLLVILTHCCEPFYLGGDGSQILTGSDAYWVAFMNSFPRACVALFVIASSYLQFPLHYDTKEFFKRRAVRVLIPLLIWTVVYACLWPAENGNDLWLNFSYAAGHLWFVYMLAGLYLLMPLLSPWAEKVGKRELQFYLAIWLFTTLIPLIRIYIGGPAPVIYGPTGIPNAAKYPLWGEASWNSYGLFYYFSGFIGYMLLGLYFRKFVGELSWKKTLAIAIPAFAAGFALCSYGFLSRVWADTNGIFPFNGPVGHAALWEAPWLNDTFGVAMMAIGWILIFRKIKEGGSFYKKVLLPVSNASYGMYLCHLIILIYISNWMREALLIGDAGVLGIWTTPVQIVCATALTFCATALFCVIVRRIPKVGKCIIG